MACIQYVYRRGAVYWWRRRLPIGMGSRGLVRVELSLMTRIAATAKAVASEVTRACERLLPELRHNMISAEDAKKILLDVATRHSEWLDLSASTKGDAISAEQSRRSETCSGWAFRLFAAHGSNATVGPNEEREMRAAGLDADQIVRVSNCIDFYREYGFGQPERKGLEALLRKHNIPVVDVHIAQAKNLYYRGMSAALLNTERRWSGVRPDDLTLLQASLAQGSALPLPAAVQPARVTSPDPVKRPPWLQRPEAMDVRSVEVSYDNSVVEQTAILEDGSSSIGCQDRYPTEVQGVAVPADITREDYRGLVELVTRAGDERVNGEDWDTKTADQHVRLAKLFVRFIGHDDPLKIRQSHIADFKSIFHRMPKNYGKSPKDFLITVDEILKRAEALPASERGFAKSTINRHMTQMSNIADICKHAGFPFANFEGVKGLRSKKKKISGDDSHIQSS